MTTLEKQLDEKQKMVNGKLTQAKDIVHEKWDDLQNDELPRLAAKKDEVVQQVHMAYDDTWVGRHSVWLWVGTAVSAVLLMLAFLFIRSRKMA